MDDRFQFRAWDLYNKKMLKVESMEFFDDGDIIVNDDRPVRYNNRPCLILMQCTGKKDKNGTLIWEGDKIEGRATKNHPKETYTVRWDINCWTIPRMSWLYEIIGHIYEED